MLSLLRLSLIIWFKSLVKRKSLTKQQRNSKMKNCKKLRQKPKNLENNAKKWRHEWLNFRMNSSKLSRESNRFREVEVVMVPEPIDKWTLWEVIAISATILRINRIQQRDKIDLEAIIIVLFPTTWSREELAPWAQVSVRIATPAKGIIVTYPRIISHPT